MIKIGSGVIWKWWWFVGCRVTSSPRSPAGPGRRGTRVDDIIDDGRACASAASLVSSVVTRASATEQCMAGAGSDGGDVGPT